MPNDSAEKVLLTSENDVFGGHLVLLKYKIVNYSAVRKVVFLCISSKICSGLFLQSQRLMSELAISYLHVVMGSTYAFAGEPLCRGSPNVFLWGVCR